MLICSSAFAGEVASDGNSATLDIGGKFARPGGIVAVKDGTLGTILVSEGIIDPLYWIEQIEDGVNITKIDLNTYNHGPTNDLTVIGTPKPAYVAVKDGFIHNVCDTGGCEGTFGTLSYIYSGTAYPVDSSLCGAEDADCYAIGISMEISDREIAKINMFDRYKTAYVCHKMGRLWI